jgi:dethiobiotin synthetase
VAEVNIFVTGTSTNIGKTISCAWLCNLLSANYHKPIQSGIENKFPHTDSDFIRSLNLPHTTVFDETYMLKTPVSPHISSLIDKVSIDIEKITTNIHAINNQGINNQSINNKNIESKKPLIIEGAGGVYVPLNMHKKMYIIDLIKKLNCGCIVVASSDLGTINHTCLTIKALQQQNIPILGIIMSGNINSDNKQAIEYYTNIKVMVELPVFSSDNNWEELKSFNKYHYNII